MKVNKCLFVLMSAIIAATSFGCGADMPAEITIISPRSERVVVLSNDEVTAFIRNPEDFSVFDKQTATDRFYMKGVDFNWKCDLEAEEYQVRLSLDPDMPLDNSLVFSTNDTFLHVDDLFASSAYYMKIVSTSKGQAIRSDVLKFYTAPTPRAIKIDGLFNVRDLGGKKLENGKRIRQNMIFRGSNADLITEEGKKQVISLNIKTDLDLRAETEGLTNEKSMMGDNVRLTKIESPMYAFNQSGIHNEQNYPAIRSIFETLTNADNYPLYMHCQIGRDRTGTISALLLALLGASEDDIVLDYQMSFFSGNAMTDPNATPELLTGRIRGIIDYLYSLSDEDTADLQKCCERYLKTVGITQTQIDNIRNFLTE